MRCNHGRQRTGLPPGAVRRVRHSISFPWAPAWDSRDACKGGPGTSASGTPPSTSSGACTRSARRTRPSCTALLASNRKGQSRLPGPDLRFSHLNPIIRGDSQSLSFPLMLSGQREFPSPQPVPRRASGKYAGCCSAFPRRSAPKTGNRDIVFPAGSGAPRPLRRGWWP